MGNVCQGGVGQAPARQATLFAGNKITKKSNLFKLMSFIIFRITQINYMYYYK